MNRLRSRFCTSDSAALLSIFDVVRLGYKCTAGTFAGLLGDAEAGAECLSGRVVSNIRETLESACTC